MPSGPIMTERFCCIIISYHCKVYCDSWRRQAWARQGGAVPPKMSLSPQVVENRELNWEKCSNFDRFWRQKNYQQCLLTVSPSAGCLTLLEIMEIYWNNFPSWKLAKSPGNFLSDSKFSYFTVYQ